LPYLPPWFLPYFILDQLQSKGFFFVQLLNKLWGLLVIKCELSGCLSRLMGPNKKQRIRSFFMVVDSKYPFAIQSLVPDNGPGGTPALVPRVPPG
jgi:hypothetical protein